MSELFSVCVLREKKEVFFGRRKFCWFHKFQSLLFANPTTYVSKSEAHLERCIRARPLLPVRESLAWKLPWKNIFSLFTIFFVSQSSFYLHRESDEFATLPLALYLSSLPLRLSELSLRRTTFIFFERSPKPHRNGLKTSYHHAPSLSLFLSLASDSAILSREPKWWRLISWPVV